MGDQVYNIHVPDNVAARVNHATLWTIVLSYEFAIRKEACRLIMHSGKAIDEAMIIARKNTEIKERYFIAPFTMSMAVASTPRFGQSSHKRANHNDAVSRLPKKGKGKGSGKGKARVKGGAAWHSSTPDGRKLCFAWNSASERCKGQCSFVHACQICFGNHPAYTCKKNGPPGPPAAESST